MYSMDAEKLRRLLTEVQEGQVGLTKRRYRVTFHDGVEVERVEAPVFSSGEPYLLFVGRLRIRKGVEILLEALARLRQEIPDLRLVLAGDGEQRLSLERRAASLQMTEGVRSVEDGA